MFSPIMYQLIATLVVDHGVEVEKYGTDTPFFDLASRAKSYMHLYEEDREFVLRMRYNEEYRISIDNDVDAVLLWLAEHFAFHALHGRSFGNERWDEICRERNIEPDYGSM